MHFNKIALQQRNNFLKCSVFFETAALLVCVVTH